MNEQNIAAHKVSYNLDKATLMFISFGLCVKEIAGCFKISERAVGNHLTRGKKRFRLRNSAEITNWSIKHKLIP